SSNTRCAPSPSCTSAVVTTNASTSPVMSTSVCRLRPTIFFSRVVPSFSRVIRRLDGLAVQGGGTWFRRLALDFQAQVVADFGVQRLPQPGQLPTSHLRVDRLPPGEVVWQHPPRTTGPQQIPVGVENLPNRDLARPAIGCLGPQVRFDTLPLSVGKIGRIGLACFHPRHLPNPRPFRYTNFANRL